MMGFVGYTERLKTLLRLQNTYYRNKTEPELRGYKMTITRNFDGSITISTIYKGCRVHQLYIGYPIRVAKKLFRNWLSGIKK